MKRFLCRLAIFLTFGAFLGASAQSAAIRPDSDSAQCPMLPVCSGEDTLLIIPAEVSEIPAHAYKGCRSLRKVKFEEGSQLRKIGDFAFASCSALEEIELPPGLERIGDFAFIYCENLRRILFPQGLKGVGMNSFSRCLSLEEAILPASVERLESYAFADCVNLRRAVVPDLKRDMGEQVFNCCRNLETIEISAPEPPRFECNSYLSDLQDAPFYEKCILIVPRGSEEKYHNAHGWGKLKIVSNED